MSESQASKSGQSKSKASSKSKSTKYISPFSFDVKEIKEVGNVQAMQERNSSSIEDDQYELNISAVNSAITLPLFDSISVSVGFESSLNLVENSILSVPSLIEVEKDSNDVALESLELVEPVAANATLHRDETNGVSSTITPKESPTLCLIESNIKSDSNNPVADNLMSPLSKVSKFRTRIKEISNTQNSDPQNGSKKVWKGTVGEIGRKAKVVEKEKKIVFTKR